MEKIGYVIIGVIVGIIIGSIFLIGGHESYYMPMDQGQSGPTAGYGDGRYYPPGCCQGPVNFESNGEKIYFTGINEKGERIPFTGGPQWLIMHGGSCVNCHGRDGSGGFVPMMCDETSPNIKYTELAEEGMSEDEIKIAITKGIHEGKELDWCMPRWQMSKKDLDDLIEYLKKLDSV